MKPVLISITLLFAISMAGQATTPPADKPHQHDHAAATAPRADHDMHAMMNKCMESMTKALPIAEKNLADMKAALAQMKTEDPAAKRLAELNVAMWEAEIGHMKEMAAMHDKMKDAMKSNRGETTKTN